MDSTPTIFCLWYVSGNWSLHLGCVKAMLPWYFALDRMNYARYLSVYLSEMLALPTTHPYVHQHLNAGEFSVQRQSAYGFAKVGNLHCLFQMFIVSVHLFFLILVCPLILFSIKVSEMYCYTLLLHHMLLSC